MGKTLIIAEKPKVAQQLLQCSRFKGMKRFVGSKPYYGYFENDKYIVTWARGHLFEVMNPGEHDEKYKAFQFDNLPIILPLRYKPINDSKEQISIIFQLMNRAEILVNAADNDKEGELLFREIYEESKTNKPLYRIWLSSYEPEEVEAAFNNLLDGKDFDSLADSARARQYLDTLMGDTITRASTTKLAQNKFLLSGGRIQLCLLNEIRKRELEVENFVPKTFYNFFADVGFLAQLQIESEYVLDPKPFQELAERLKGTDITVKEFKEKESKRTAPNLFNATDFLKACIQKLKLKAPEAKAVLQKLYEEGLVSYPRSDSRHLPVSMIDSVREVIGSLGNESSLYKDQVCYIDIESVNEKHRSFDDEKVTSHFAIIPTKKPFPEGKSELERQVYDLIVKRFISNFMKPAVYNVREILIVDSEGNTFLAKEKVLVSKGFLTVYEEDQEEEREEVKDSFSLPETAEGASFNVKDCIVKEGKTSKPGYHTETSILTFMETAGRNLVEDEEIKELLKGKRIGTAATAESFIPKLIERKYIVDEKGKLKTTSLGASFIEVFPIEELKNPIFTAEMEESIAKIESKELSYEDFKKETISFAEKIVADMANISEEITLEFHKAWQKEVEICSCSCGKGKIIDKGNFVGCTMPDCTIRLPKVIKGKAIPNKQIELLVTKGETEVIKGFKADERTFDAVICLEDGKLKFKTPTFGTCPKCHEGQIRKNQTKEKKEFYGCTNYQNGCNFSIPSVIKQKKIPEGQIKKLIEQRTTDFINGFIGKNDSQFTARLVVKSDGNLEMKMPTIEDRTLGKCPLCKANVISGKSYYLCENYKKTCDFILSPTLAEKQIPVGQIKKLLEKNLTDTIKGFKSKKGEEFSAKLSYNTEEKKLSFIFEKKKQAKK
ncbi:DNA topoisomerase [Metabacillus fastidiosus]|uniref:DNA topoisomerase n=1 Tax=Metabacillus fastidiosus TaxID=1458 RepID=UPI002E1D2B1C|nr:DNA topoisomerase [Metabacillus fastidiosus]MED4455644.1 DNA topoisomerase [Metabacillus fastidiosus]